jgi:hypothetical protein
MVRWPNVHDAVLTPLRSTYANANNRTGTINASKIHDNSRAQLNQNRCFIASTITTRDPRWLHEKYHWQTSLTRDEQAVESRHQ